MRQRTKWWWRCRELPRPCTIAVDSKPDKGSNGREAVRRALDTLEHRIDAAATRHASPIDSLSARERQVLQLVVEGRSSAGIAATIHLSPKSVDNYRARLMKKLGVADVPALVKFAIQHGLTPAD